MIARKRVLLAAIAVLAVSGLGAGMLGVASGEGPVGSTATRTVSVEGVGTLPIGADDTASQATTVYREAMAKALADGQAKAAFLAEKAGASLGVATTIVEDGGGIECTEADGDYGEYEGEQPDFGYGTAPTTIATAAPESAASKSPTVSHRPKVSKKQKRHHGVAHAASASRCNLSANVSEVYAIG